MRYRLVSSATNESKIFGKGPPMSMQIVALHVISD